MILDIRASERVAKILLQVNAIKLNTKEYFNWASGWKSPIYCDNRILLSYPDFRTEIAQIMKAQIKQKFVKVDVIAAVATGAIGIGMLVANLMQLPMIYIRPEAKGHGRKNQIEGYLEKNKKVVIIEDLISTGMSSLKAFDALKQKDVEVLGMIAIFSYAFDVAKNNFNKAGVDLCTLSNYFTLIDEAEKLNYIKKSEKKTLQMWRENPQKWNQY